MSRIILYTFSAAFFIVVMGVAMSCTYTPPTYSDSKYEWGIDTMKKRAFKLSAIDGLTGQFIGTGSGVYLRDRFLLTNAHVCAALLGPVIIQAKNPYYEKINYEVVQMFFHLQWTPDICLVELKRKPRGIPAVSFADTLTLGEVLYVPGFSGGGGYSIHRTHLIGYAKLEVLNPFTGGDMSQELMEFDYPILPGGSGSGIYNRRGQLIGIVNAMDGLGHGLGPDINAIKKFLEEAKNAGVYK